MSFDFKESALLRLIVNNLDTLMTSILLNKA
jgi:hypothetical protein